MVEDWAGENEVGGLKVFCMIREVTLGEKTVCGAEGMDGLGSSFCFFHFEIGDLGEVRYPIGSSLVIHKNFLESHGLVPVMVRSKRYAPRDSTFRSWLAIKSMSPL